MKTTKTPNITVVFKLKVRPSFIGLQTRFLKKMGGNWGNEGNGVNTF